MLAHVASLQQEALGRRTRPFSPERALDVALDLEGDALAAWLLDPSAP